MAAGEVENEGSVAAADGGAESGVGAAGAEEVAAEGCELSSLLLGIDGSSSICRYNPRARET